MDSQEVGDLLEECHRAASSVHQHSQSSEATRLSYVSYRDSLCAELASLLQEAIEMKWPFVPEKWQYTQSVSAKDKTNLTDLISKHLPQLLALLKVAILAQEVSCALGVAFLMDRFLYWKDESRRLLKITKMLHRHPPDTPVAPQLIIRQARLYLNSGKLQKAEYILSSLINNSGATGCWVYHSESDRALVQAVSVQVRGLVLQKLGLWLEAAELIWASLVGYYALPQPDKKGIGTSLGILANILISMNDEDFHAFKTNPDIDLSLLGDCSHRLLSAAEAAKLAVVHSQYTSLYVLTNVATQGTCLLSYSFSVDCPSSERNSFLLKAREAFEIGLLTKAEGELVTSQQELHTFLKAAYSLTVTHKWLGNPSEMLTPATQACKEAVAHFYDYCQATDQEKDARSTEIMYLIGQVKHLLQVTPFHNSDEGSFIPDSYRNFDEKPVSFTLDGFAKVIGRFQKYHASLCETTDIDCKMKTGVSHGSRLCITALGTTIGTLNTDYTMEACKGPMDKPKGELGKTLASTDDLGSSWQKCSFISSGSPRPSSSSYTGSIAYAKEHKLNVSNESSLLTEITEDGSYGVLEPTNENRRQEGTIYKVGVNSHIDPRSITSSCAGSDADQFELLEAMKETVGSEEDWTSDVFNGSIKPSGIGGATQSISNLTLRTSSSFLNDSFSSQSSWEKISSIPISPIPNLNHPKLPVNFQSKPGMRHTSGESSSCTSGIEFQTPCDSHLLKSFDVDLNAETEMDSLPVGPEPVAVKKHTNQGVSTKISTGSSFEMLEMGHSDPKHSCAALDKKNPSCHSCLKQSIVVNAAPERPYVLTKQDYNALLAGVCHECLLKRLQSEEVKFKLKNHKRAYSGVHLKFSRATGLWTAKETCVFIGEPMGMAGKQREALWVQFVHQEERLSSYVGKDYLKPKHIQFHLKDVERQMTAQYYVTEFNKRLYEKEVTAQIFFIPSEVLLILEGDEIVGCVTVEPYMLGEFVKLTNNTVKKDKRFQATDYGIAFGHFTYQFSECQEVVVDLQGWVTANGKGLTYLTDPQIHSSKTPRGPSNFSDRGLRYFLEEQHGPECNAICQWLKLAPVDGHSHQIPPKV